jgi:uroporphyrinogen decarboxylase
MNELFLNALNCKNLSSRPPVWLMRQAGRYMPEYRDLRKKYSFLELCHNPELIAKVTMLPLDAFQMDAAILFSDILVIPEAFNLGLSFEDKKGPIIHRPLSTTQDIDNLVQPDVNVSLKYVADGIKALLPRLKVPLIGFSGAPFTLASYMIEGGSSKDLKKTKQMLINNPASFHKLLEKITESVIAYLNMQIEAGVQALQIFDSWAGVLCHEHFREFSLDYLKKILQGIKKTVPVILFCRGSSFFAPQLAELKPAGISIDWQADLQVLRNTIPQGIALQGNLDPDILYGSESVIVKSVKNLLEKMKGDKGFIFNLGHGMQPDMSPHAVRVLVETIKNS